MKIFLTSFFILLAFAGGLISPALVLAEDSPNNTEPDVTEIKEGLRGLNKFPNTSFQTLFGRAAIFAAIGLTGTVAMIMFIYAGMLWMFSGGNSERQKKALTLMIWTSAGLAVLFASYSLVSFILSVLAPQ